MIEAARDRHASFDQYRHPDPILLRFLDRMQRGLLGKGIQRNAQLFAATHTFAFPLTTWASGVVIPFVYHLLLGGKVELIDGARLSFDIVPYGQGEAAYPFYAAWVLGTRLYFKGDANDWTGVVAVHVDYVPTVEQLTALNAHMTLPRSAADAMVESCAAFMAGRAHSDPQLPAIDEAAFIRRAEKAEEAWLLEVAAMKRTQTKTIREVW